MEPIAVGFMILIGAAAFMGVIVGAVGGAVVWRVRSNLALGGLLTACAYVLVLVARHHGDLLWLRAELAWGGPSMALTFLIGSLSARWVAAHTALRPAWTTLAAFGVALSLGVLYLLLFRVNLELPRLAALWADVVLILLLMGSRTLVRQ
jgi:hypothetical protein